MPGGLFQLSAYGDENQYINGNPQMSWFRSVYKQYTNFAMEFITFIPRGNTEFELELPTKYVIEVPLNGDMLNNFYVSIDLPDIYSDDIRQFEWVENIGFTMIKKISFLIGGQVIQSFTGEYIQAYYQLHLTDEKQQMVNEMTGNTPVFYSPKDTNPLTYTYPSSSNNPPLFGNIVTPPLINNGYNVTESNVFNNLTPSIRKQSLYIPIPFWFTKDSSVALPLLALLYDVAYIELEIRPINELFTYKEYIPITLDEYLADPNLGKDDVYMLKTIFTSSLSELPPNPNYPLYYPSGIRRRPPIGSDIFYSFLIPQQLVTTGSIFNDFTPTPPPIVDPFYVISLLEYLIPPVILKKEELWAPQVRFIGQFIFLEQEERRMFAQSNNKYLIEEVIYIDYPNSEYPVIYNGKNTLLIDYNFNPIKEIWIAPIKTEFRNTNRWMNYTLNQSSLSNLAYQSNLTYTLNTKFNNGYDYINSNLAKNSFSLYSYSSILAPQLAYYNNSTDTLIPFFTNTFIHTNSYNDINRFRDIWDYYSLNDIPYLNRDNYDDYYGDIIRSVKIRFNKDTTREETKPNKYWNLIQPYMYYQKSVPGLIVYSFALNPLNIHPSGSCLFSEIKSVECILDIKDTDIQLKMYLTALNILNINNGMGRMIFGN